jgi:hypothetical protein
VFANIGFSKPEFVGQQEGFAILLQGQPPILVERMDRHCEETQIHRALLPWHGIRTSTEPRLLDRIMTNPKVESLEIIAR